MKLYKKGDHVVIIAVRSQPDQVDDPTKSFYRHYIGKRAIVTHDSETSKLHMWDYLLSVEGMNGNFRNFGVKETDIVPFNLKDNDDLSEYFKVISL